MSFENSSLEEVLLAFAEDISQLAALHAEEPSWETIERLREVHFPNNFSVELASEAGCEAKKCCAQGLANLPRQSSTLVLDTLAADFADIYLNYTFGASPCESVWIDEDNLILQEPTFQVRKLYREHGLQASNWRSLSEDHLVAELEFLAFLLGEKKQEALPVIERFLDDHLLRWLPAFCALVSERAATVYFSSLAALTACYLEELRKLLEHVTGVSRPSKEEVDARMKPQRLVTIGGHASYVPGSAPTW